MEKKLIHLDDGKREELEVKYEKHLKLNSYGKCSSRIWSDFPEGYGDVTKFYLLQALLSRFMLHHVRHHPDLAAVNLGLTNLADAAERVERDVPLTQFEGGLGISVAGEMFLVII